MTAAGLIDLEIALLPEEIKVLQMLAQAGGQVIAAIRARQQGNPATTPVLQTGESAWNAIQAMAAVHADAGKPSA